MVITMKKYLSLVKLAFVQQYRAKPTNAKNKRSGTVIAFVVLGICFLPVLVAMAVFTYMLGSVTGTDSHIVTLLITVCQGLVLIFGTPSLLTNVFNGKDADRLLYLPIKSTTLFAAKFTVVYLNEVITTAVTVLFLLLPYGIGAGATAAFYLMLPFALVLVPVLPLLVGCALAIPVSVLLAKIGKNGIVRTVVQIVLFAAIFALYIWGFSSVQGDSVEGDTSSMQEIVLALVHQLQATGQNLQFLHSNGMLAASTVATSFVGWLVPFLITLAENAALFAVVMLIAWPCYRKILSSSVESGGALVRRSTTQKQLQVKNNGVVKELVRADLKRTARNSQMGFQAFAGLVLMPIMILFFFFAFNETDVESGASLIEVLRGDALYQTIAPLVIVAYMSLLGIGSNVLGLYPISRENNSLYLLKSLPISFEKILLAKVILSTAVMVAVDFVTIVLSVVLFKLHWYVGILMFATMVLLGFGGMCITTLIDLKSPKLGWTNFNQSLKNAKNSWLAMLIGLVILVAMALIATVFIVWYNVTAQKLALVLMWVVILMCAALFAWLSHKVMGQNASRYFAKIEA